MKLESASFAQALASGFICVHPTDTIPGLTFDPTNDSAVRHMSKIKGSRENKGYISLVSSLDKALRYWKPLPRNWENTLKILWPNPVSVIWKAADDAPDILKNKDGLLALRVPRLADTLAQGWFLQLLEKLAAPFPTTSVNIAGEAPALTWEQALQFAKSKSEIYIPADEGFAKAKSAKVNSTLIEIKENGDFVCLREGALSKVEIDAAVQLS